MRVVETTVSDARFNITIFFLNPTPYTLNIGYLHVHLFHDNILIGEGSISDITSKPNSRTEALADFKLQPFITPDSKDAVTSLVTKYICGKKAELEIRLHDKSIPSMPHLSHILSETFRVKLVIPKLSPDQSSDTILEANEPSSRRDQEFLHENENVGSPNDGLESPLIYGAEMFLTSSTVQLTLFNPLNVPLHISHITASASHNSEHLGDVDLPDGWSWHLEPGVQKTPKLSVRWSAISFAMNPRKGMSMLSEGWERSGEVSVDVCGRADVRIGELEMGQIEVNVPGIATKVCL
jgi:hypothetical protein